MKLHYIGLSIVLLMSLILVNAEENPNVGLGVPEIGREVKLPDNVYVHSIYNSGTGNLVWKDIRRMGKDKLILILQSPWTIVSATVVEDGVARKFGRKELLTVVKGKGYEVSHETAKSRKGTFKGTRKSIVESADIGKCTSVFVAGPNENMPRWKFLRLPEREKLRILSHPKTKAYLSRCK